MNEDTIDAPRRGWTVVDEGDIYEVDGLQRYVSYCGCTDGRHKGVYRSNSPHDLPSDWNIHPVQVEAYEVVVQQ